MQLARYRLRHRHDGALSIPAYLAGYRQQYECVFQSFSFLSLSLHTILPTVPSPGRIQYPGAHPYRLNPRRQGMGYYPSNTSPLPKCPHPSSSHFPHPSILPLPSVPRFLQSSPSTNTTHPPLSRLLHRRLLHRHSHKRHPMVRRRAQKLQRSRRRARRRRRPGHLRGRQSR